MVVHVATYLLITWILADCSPKGRAVGSPLPVALCALRWAWRHWWHRPRPDPVLDDPYRAPHDP